MVVPFLLVPPGSPSEAPAFRAPLPGVAAAVTDRLTGAPAPTAGASAPAAGAPAPVAGAPAPAAAAPAPVAGAHTSSDGFPADTLDARIWLDLEGEAALERGDSVRVYYRTSLDAFVVVAHLDTEGRLRLVIPSDPSGEHSVMGERNYRLLQGESSVWRVREDPGTGHYFLLAAPEPFDLSGLRYSRFEGGWDLGDAGRRLWREPQAALDRLVELLVQDPGADAPVVGRFTYVVEGRR